LPDSNKQPILPLEPDPDMVGRHSYRNPNCHLAVRGAKPYRRCNHCRLHTRQCLGIQNLGIVFLIGFLLLFFLLLDHGMLERVNIVAIVSLLFVLSYRINTSLDSLSKSDLTNTELNLRLREHTENLERRILSRTEELKKLATTDTLTGLVNRGEFENQLGELVDRANEQDQVHAMCFMDLDQFKIINDVCGHVAGDELLRQIRPLLEAHVRDADIVARFGGDEFAILFPFCDVGHAAEIAERIRESIDGFRFFWEGSSYAIGVSMGVVGISRGSGTVATTLAAADAACYRAKELGRNRICVHEPDAEDVDAHHIQMRWSTRITDALDRQRLRLSFQEIVPARDTVDTRPHYEVLVRMEDDNGGEPLRFMAISSLRPTFVHGTAYALTPEELQKSAQLLAESGFFDRPEVDPADLQPPDLLVVVRVGDLVRTVRWGVGEGEAALRDALLAHFRKLAAENDWQLWQDLLKQPSWELFFAENSRWFSEHQDPAERTARLRDMITASFTSLTGTDLKLRAIRTLGDLPGGAAALSPEQVQRVTRSVWTEPDANEFTAAVVQFVVPILKDEQVPTVVEALADKVGPVAQSLLVGLFESLPAERTAGFAADPRWKVRRAVVDALGKAETLPPVAREALSARLEDEEVLVRMGAAEALGRRKDPAILPALETLAGDRSGDVRAAAAYAYGLLANDEAREKLGPLLYRDPSSRVRERAVQGLAEGGDARAAPMLLQVFRDEPELNVRAAAASAIVRLETPAVVDEVVSRLELSSAASPERVALVNVLARFESPRVVPLLRTVLQGDDPISADAAALGLARRWDDGAMGQLIRMLENGRSQRAAVRHLQQLTSRAFETESYDRQAENYKAWYAANATGNPRVWFREALSERGYDVGPLQAWSEVAGIAVPEVPDEAVPMLLRVLRDKDPYLQINASMLLDMRMGDAAPEPITWLSTTDEAERAIRAYVDWWAKRSRENEARERG